MSATTGPSAAGARRRSLFHYSRDRRGEHPERHLAGYAGILQADAYGGFNGLYDADRMPAGRSPKRSAGRMRRRKFFELAELSPGRARRPPISPWPEAVRRIDAIFAIERAING